MRTPGRRVVFATSSDGRTEIVRYDRAGRYYSERADGLRRAISVREAADLALSFAEHGGTFRIGLPGGSRFDSECFKPRDAA